MNTKTKEITNNEIYEQEIKNVQANKFLSESEKESKISELKRLITVKKKKEVSPAILAFSNMITAAAKKNDAPAQQKPKPATKLPDNLSPAIKDFINKNNSHNK